MKTALTALAMAAVLATGHAQADVLAAWNFNSLTPDGNTGTGSTAASAGMGSASLVGGVTGGFASGTANGGSSDPASTDNSGWQTSNYRAAGAGDKTAGVQFNVSTLGFEDVVVSYDLRHSNTSSRYEQFQYSLDGLSFVDFLRFDGNAGDTWFRRSVDLSSIVGVDNNSSFAFRVVSTFAPGTLAYAASNPGSSYGTAGTWRFDMVAVNAAVVPEPATYAMLLAGLALMGSIARRRQL